MKTAFGLDPAGYSTGKSAFCRIDQATNNNVTATVYSGHIFSKKIEGKIPFTETVGREVELLAACCKKAPIIIDIPIDLQGLPFLENAKYSWQLTKRSVDFAFDALPALADKLGSPCARFLNLYTLLAKKLESPLGKQLFETYPAASLELIDIPSEKYKPGEISFKNGYWDWKKGDGKSEKLAEIAEAFKLTACEGLTLNDDEVDSIICATAGIVEEERLLRGSELATVIKKRLHKKLNVRNLDEIQSFEPKGYVLLKELPAFEIKVEKKEVKTFGETLSEVLR